jgi:hypothetical protein
MKRLYLYAVSVPVHPETLTPLLKSCHLPFTLYPVTPNSGYVEADDSFAVPLDSLLFAFHEEHGFNLSFLASHRQGPLEDKLLQEALAYFPNQVVYLSDTLMKEFSFGDYSSLSLLSQEFEGVPRELMLTAGTFLREGLSETQTAQRLIIHRNTFNYRLARFIAKTNLDIRDYHNALLLEIYFQFSNYK